uniref:hypothetical protein n=1 Tax=Olsenella uli TaxID=133926 RepID=UPI0028E9905D|nr:hypothetical protein [Olsenella uli]
MSHALQRVRRTQTQVILHVVSIVLTILSLIVGLIGIGVVGAWFAGGAGLVDTDQSTLTGGLLTFAAAVLVLVTGVLGIISSEDYSKVGPYRGLCYSVSLLILLVLIYGWANGTFLLFNPLVLMATTIYVLICSTLADRVQSEYDLGIKGELITRDATQRTLHFLASIITIEGVMYLVAGGVAYYVLDQHLLGPDAQGGAVGLLGLVNPGGTLTLETPAAIALAIVALGILRLMVGLLGIRGSNHPQRVTPFLAVCLAVSAIQVLSFVASVARAGLGGANYAETLLSLLLYGTCAGLSLRIRQGRGASGASPARQGFPTHQA